MKYTTEQEEFWAGEFGDDYIDRNQGESVIASNTALFSKVLKATDSISSVVEFGANTGVNLLAIRRLLPNVLLSAIEINEKAVSQLKQIENIEVYHSSIFDFQPDKKRDLALIKGVLIHINPNKLHEVYQLLYEVSNKDICIAEYYSPSSVEVRYRGHEERLFKRDFAGDAMEQFPDLNLIDYGFVYHGDNNFPQDDLTWFLLEKS